MRLTNATYLDGGQPSTDGMIQAVADARQETGLYDDPAAQQALPHHPLPRHPSGADPATGLPLSRKSRFTAGLLQTLPGFFLGLGGIGRLYAGNNTIGAIQMCVSPVGWISLCFGYRYVFPYAIFIALWAWFTADGIVILAGHPLDGEGRLLRR
jgi:hypothetical protein